MVVGRVTFGNGAMGEVLQFDNRRKKKMKHHWGWTILILVLAYLAGVAFPRLGKPIVSKLGLGAA